MHPSVSAQKPMRNEPVSSTSRTAADGGRGCAADVGLGVFYTINDIRKRPRNCAIGFTSVFVVVLVTGLILLSISKSPVVFLRFAELTTGEMDALILAEGSVPFANYTDLKPKIDASERTSGSAPRWLIKGTFSQLPLASEAKPAGEILSTSTNVLIIDSKHEKDIGIGRAFHYRQIGYSEAQVLSTILDYAGIEPNTGQRASLNIDIAGILDQQQVDLGVLTAPGVNATPATPVAVNGSAVNTSAIDQFVALNPTINIPGFGAVNTSGLLQANQQTALLNNVNLLNNATALLNQFQTGIPAFAISSFLSPTLRMTVADGFPDSMGKYPGTLGNMAIMDYKPLVQMLLEELCYETLRQPLINFGSTATVAALPPTSQLLETLNLSYYTLVIVAMLQDRFNVYYLATTPRTASLIDWSNNLFYAIGVDFGGSAQFPVAIALAGYDFFQLFLFAIMFVASAIIVVLGAILVYTLLVTNAEERGFEVAMLRAQGMTKVQLFLLMGFQLCAFLLPAIACGISAILFLNAMIELALTLFTYAPPETARIGLEAVLVPLFVGIFVPLVANIAPVRAALAQSLRDALDVYRNKSAETTVVATKLAELGMDPFVIMVAWFLVIVGFLVYYLVPLAFIFNELWLFFLVMDIILLIMLFGLCMISSATQQFLERGLLWLMLWGKETRLRTLVVKNFHSHGERNAKAFMMFTLSVACIVFGGVLFTLLSSSISQTVEVLTGAPVTVTSLDFKFPLNQTILEPFLALSNATVAAWAYESFPLSAYPQVQGKSIIGNAIGSPAASQNFIALSERFLDAAYTKYVLIDDLESGVSYSSDTQGTSGPDIVRSLYSKQGVATLQQPRGSVTYSGYPPNQTVPDVSIKYSMIMPAISASSGTSVIGITAGAFGTVRFTYRIGQSKAARNVDTNFLTDTRALVRKFPGTLSVSPLPFAFPNGPTFISQPNFLSLVRANAIDFPTKKNDPNYQYTDSSAQQVYQRKLYVRLQPGLTAKQRSFFVNLLQSKVNAYYHLTLDTQSVVDSVNVAASLIMVFFYFASVICIILDTLMLWLTFVSNVQLNSWSIAVLRSLGFTVAQLRRAFIYESLCIVLAGFIMGTIIGTLVAVTLVLQLNLFLQLPFAFAFPVELFFFLLGLSLISAVIAPAMPTRSIAARAIASVLKGG